MVAQQLHFDVAQRSDVLLQVNVAVAERRPRLGGYAAEQLMEGARGFHQLDAFAAAAMHSLDEDGIADFLREVRGPQRIRHHAVAARHHRHPEPHGRGDGVGLVAHRLHAGNRRADEVDAVGTHQLSELAALGEEADARMQRVHPLVLRHG